MKQRSTIECPESNASDRMNNVDYHKIIVIQAQIRQRLAKKRFKRLRMGIVTIQSWLRKMRMAESLRRSLRQKELVQRRVDRLKWQKNREVEQVCYRYILVCCVLK